MLIIGRIQFLMAVGLRSAVFFFSELAKEPLSQVLDATHIHCHVSPPSPDSAMKILPHIKSFSHFAVFFQKEPQPF